MANLTKTTQDHEEIRRWAEERGGKPSHVKSTESADDIGILRIDFPGFSGEGSLEEIPWEDFFEKFDAQGLALIYQEETAEGERSNFNKLVHAETASNVEEGSHRSAGPARKAPSKKGVKKTPATAKKVAARPAVAKQAAPARAAGKKVVAKKVATKKAVAKKAPAKKVIAKKAAVKKAPAKKAPIKKAVKKTPAKKALVLKKTVTKKAIKKTAVKKRR